MALVVVPHLDPSIRDGCPTFCNAVPPEDGQPAQPDSVYVTPPGRRLTIMNGVLLDDLAAVKGEVIDPFSSRWPPTWAAAPSA